MIEYIVREELEPGIYTVSKWSFGDVQPLAVYKVNVSMGKPTCNCASGMYRGWCKHIDMVQKHRKNYDR